MSLTTLDIAMSRIELALPHSPIAVFRTDVPRRLNTVFANTAMTQDLIRGQSSRLIGVFHGQMNLERVRVELRRHVMGEELHSNGHAERV